MDSLPGFAMALYFLQAVIATSMIFPMSGHCQLGGGVHQAGRDGDPLRDPRHV